MRTKNTKNTMIGFCRDFVHSDKGTSEFSVDDIKGELNYTERVAFSHTLNFMKRNGEIIEVDRIPNNDIHGSYKPVFIRNAAFNGIINRSIISPSYSKNEQGLIKKMIFHYLTENGILNNKINVGKMREDLKIKGNSSIYNILNELDIDGLVRKVNVSRGKNDFILLSKDFIYDSKKIKTSYLNDDVQGNVTSNINEIILGSYENICKKYNIPMGNENVVTIWTTGRERMSEDNGIKYVYCKVPFKYEENVSENVTQALLATYKLYPGKKNVEMSKVREYFKKNMSEVDFNEYLNYLRKNGFGFNW